MLWKRSIRKTLLDNLLTRPRAINMREFRRARSHLFPGPELFASFLSTDSHQEMTEHAKSIITRLSHHHHLSPPTRLIFNLLDFEDRYGQKFTEGDYIPQDHFVHLAHLYLLGVYFFCYHRSIHKECAAALNRTKRAYISGSEGGLDKRSEPAGVYELFGSTWTLFVLYHDLGYPLERILPQEREVSKKWLYPLSKIRKSIMKDLALKSLSNLVTLSMFLREGSGDSLGEMYLSYCDDFFIDSKGGATSFGRKPADDVKEDPSEHAANVMREVLDQWEGATLVRGISGVSSLRAIGTLLPDASVAAVLENDVSGEPIAFIRKQPDENKILWLQDPKELPSSLRKLRHRFWELAFKDGGFPGEVYSWRYFAQNARDYFEKNLNDLLSDRLLDFDKICARLERDPEFKTARLVHSDAASELAYTTYRLLNRTLGYISDDEDDSPDLEIFFESIDRGFTSVSKMFPSLVGDSVQNLVRNDIEAGALTPGKLLRTTRREDAIAEVTKYLSGRMRELARLLDSAIGPHIRETVEVEQAVRDCAQSVRQTIEEKADAPSRDPFADLDALLGENFSLSGLSRVIGEIGDSLKGVLGKYHLEFLGLMEAYKPSWALQDQELSKSFVDHGLASTLVLLSSAQVYQDCLRRMLISDQPEAPRDVRLLRLALGTTAKADEAWLGVELKYLLTEVAAAVFLHNLYPSSFPGEQRSYRTTLSRQPFAFLAMLADGLQRWDRRKLASSVDGDVWGIIPGSRFDVQIKGDLIYITLRSSKINMRAEDHSLRQGLRDYLAGADNLIRLELIES